MSNLQTVPVNIKKRDYGWAIAHQGVYGVYLFISSVMTLLATASVAIYAVAFVGAAAPYVVLIGLPILAVASLVLAGFAVHNAITSLSDKVRENKKYQAVHAEKSQATRQAEKKYAAILANDENYQYDPEKYDDPIVNQIKKQKESELQNYLAEKAKLKIRKAPTDLIEAFFALKRLFTNKPASKGQVLSDVANISWLYFKASMTDIKNLWRVMGSVIIGVCILFGLGALELPVILAGLSVTPLVIIATVVLAGIFALGMVYFATRVKSQYEEYRVKKSTALYKDALGFEEAWLKHIENKIAVTKTSAVSYEEGKVEGMVEGIAEGKAQGKAKGKILGLVAGVKAYAELARKDISNIVDLKRVLISHKNENPDLSDEEIISTFVNKLQNKLDDESGAEDTSEHTTIVAESSSGEGSEVPIESGNEVKTLRAPARRSGSHISRRPRSKSDATPFLQRPDMPISNFRIERSKSAPSEMASLLEVATPSRRLKSEPATESPSTNSALPKPLTYDPRCFFQRSASSQASLSIWGPDGNRRNPEKREQGGTPPLSPQKERQEPNDDWSAITKRRKRPLFFKDELSDVPTRSGSGAQMSESSIPTKENFANFLSAALPATETTPEVESLIDTETHARSIIVS